MLQQDRMPRHYLASPSQSGSGRSAAGLTTFRGGRVAGMPRGAHRQIAATGQADIVPPGGATVGQLEALLAATTMADMASRDVPQVASPLSGNDNCSAPDAAPPRRGRGGGGTPPRVSMPCVSTSMDINTAEVGVQVSSDERPRVELAPTDMAQSEVVPQVACTDVQHREQQRQKMAETWCHSARPFVHPKRTTLRWFHGCQDEPMEVFAPIPAECTAGGSSAMATCEDRMRYRPPRKPGRSTPCGGEEDSLESPWPTALAGFTGHVGGLGDGTFGLGLSTLRTRALMIERQRGLPARLFASSGATIPAPAKYKEEPTRLRPTTFRGIEGFAGCASPALLARPGSTTPRAVDVFAGRATPEIPVRPGSTTPRWVDSLPGRATPDILVRPSSTTPRWAAPRTAAA